MKGVKMSNWFTFTFRVVRLDLPLVARQNRAWESSNISTGDKHPNIQDIWESLNNNKWLISARICDDCYMLYRDAEVHQLCRYNKYWWNTNCWLFKVFVCTVSYCIVWHCIVLLHWYYRKGLEWLALHCPFLLLSLLFILFMFLFCPVQTESHFVNRPCVRESFSIESDVNCTFWHLMGTFLRHQRTLLPGHGVIPVPSLATAWTLWW